MFTVLLPPGVNPIVVYKIKHISSMIIIPMLCNYLPSADVHSCIPRYFLTLANDRNKANSTPCDKILLGNLRVPQLVKKFPAL
jgi:hypothetical protein